MLLTSNLIKGMTEVIIDTDEHSKRRLPTWMQRNDISKNEKLGTLDGLCSISENQTEAEGIVSMIESMSSEADVGLAEKINNSENKKIFTKNHLKKNTRKPKTSDGSKDSRCNNTSGIKRKSEGEIFDHETCLEDTQHMKLKSAKRNSVKVLPQERMVDTAALTIEDLISIAEEV